MSDAKEPKNGRQDSSDGPEAHSDSNESNEKAPEPDTDSLEGVGTSFVTERYDEMGDIQVQTYNYDDDVAVSVSILGEWGSAGFSLKPEEAWELGQLLLEAGDREWQQ